MLRFYSYINTKWLQEFISFLLIILWIYAAMGQLFQLEDFRIRLIQFPFISGYATLFAWLVPVVEILIASLFFNPHLRNEANLASLTLLLIFTAYIVVVLHFADSIPCSCSGVIASLTWKEHIVFNLGLSLLALAGVLLHPHQKNLE